MNIKKNISYKKTMERKFILASNNNGKIKEMKEKLNPLGITVISQKEAGYNIEVDETGTTFEENATLKAEAIYKLSKLPVISDDSGLEIDALNGEPGIYSARYAGENATDEDRRNKFIDEIKKVDDEETLLLKLQRKYRSGEIKEEEMTENKRSKSSKLRIFERR